MYRLQGEGRVALTRRPPIAVPLVAAAVFLLDQGTKALVRAKMPVGHSTPIIDGVFHLTHVRNSGAAFGLLPGAQWLFVGVSVVAIVGIVAFWWKVRPEGSLTSVSLGLVAGGAVGNLIDRLATGRVTDFFDLQVWPVFNIADSGLIVGVAGLVLWSLLEERRRANEEKASTATADALTDAGKDV